MKTIFRSILILIFFAGTATAAPTPPTEGVRATPARTRAGDTVSLEALVYNGTERTVTVDVLFSTSEEEIETLELTIPSQAAKTAVSEWTVPEAETVITASVVRAMDANRRTVPELLGVIGTVTVGSPQAFSVGSLAVGAKTWLGGVLAVVEPWRQERAAHYGELRDGARQRLGIDSVTEINRIAPRQAEAPATEDAGRMGELAPKAPFPVEDYGTLIFASALAAIFSSAALFYISAGLLVLMLLRFFIRLFTT